MTAPHFQVDPAQLHAHAGSVSDAAAQLSAVAGGLPDGLATGALGTFVQFLTGGLGSDAQTTGWSGSAASGYRKTGSQLADGIAALGKATTTVSHATSGAGELVAHIRQIITDLITDATAKIIPILTQAVAAAPSTFGASIAAAIPQIVRIAVEHGQKIADQLRTLLSDAKNLLSLIQLTLQAVSTVTQVITQLTSHSTAKPTPVPS